MARYRRPIVIVLIVLACLGLGEFWLYSAHRLGDYLHRRGAMGLSIADLCESSDIGGFPFRLKLSCSHFAAPVNFGGQTVIFGAEELQGSASLSSPNHVVLTFSSPMVVRAADGATGVATGGATSGAILGKLRHDGMTLDIAWGLSGLSQASLEARALDWRPDTPLAGVAINLQSLKADVTPQSDGDKSALRFALVGDGLTVPALQSLLQKNDPGKLTASGAITPAPAPGGDWRAVAEDWRKATGIVSIEHMQWASGDLSVTVAGALALDDLHRPAGKFSVTSEGAGPLLARLGVPANAAQLKNVLGALLGKASDPAAKPDSLTLPLTLANGQVFLGPIRLPATVSPLY
jgi:hypothetical protein